jgi:energy-converting hydrogenase Eha subunit C
MFLGLFAVAPIFGTLASIWSNRSVANGVSYGANAIQMIVLTPMEFFNVLFLNICFLAGMGIWLDKDPLRNRLAIVTVLTIVIGIICSCFTPFFPRYYMTVSMIILLFAAVACVEISKYVPKIPPILILLTILVVFTIMMKDNYISHYTIIQYACGG